MRKTIPAAAMALLILGGSVGAQEKKEGPPGGGAPPARVARERLPVLGTVGDLPPEKERLEVEVLSSTTLRAGGETLDLPGLQALLRKRSEGLYEEKPPRVSRLYVVLRVDRDVRWQDVQWVMQACASPDVRVYRILFAAVPEDGGEEGAMAMFLPLDVGLSTANSTGPEVDLTVRLRSRDTSPAAPGPALFAHMEKAFGKRKDEVTGATLDADPVVATGAVLEAADALLRWGIRRVLFRGTSQAVVATPERPAEARPRVFVRLTAVEPPGQGGPVPPPLARVKGRLAGQAEAPPAALRETEPISESEVGVGGGPAGAFGRRRPGHRFLKEEGGAGTEAAVDLGLEWLKNHQSPNGMWDSDGFESMCKRTKCGGPGGPLFDAGVTGLALLCFLGCGETHTTPRYGPVVRDAVKYLKSIQDEEGCFGPRTSGHFIYDHCIAALAMAEAYGLTQSPLFRSSAQAGIDFIHKARNPRHAWRYGVQPGDNDTSVTGWAVMALTSARMAGLRVDLAAFDGAKAWLDNVTEPGYGRAGYTKRGNGPARPADVMDKYPADKSESLTAIAVLTRIFCGADKDDAFVRKGTNICLKVLPLWDEAAGTIDFYYWYYGSLAMFQVGGEPWKKWNEAMKTALVGSQRTSRDDDRRGSWDPVDPWASEGGRIYSTAMNVLTLEVYYRYGRVFGIK